MLQFNFQKRRKEEEKAVNSKRGKGKREKRLDPNSTPTSISTQPVFFSSRKERSWHCGIMMAEVMVASLDDVCQLMLSMNVSSLAHAQCGGGQSSNGLPTPAGRLT